MPFLRRLLSSVLAASVAGQAVAADGFYYRRLLTGNGVDMVVPSSEGAPVIRGEGNLGVLGPVQVRARPDVPFSLQLLTINAEGAVAWSSVGAPLPDGLDLSPTGLISGRPSSVVSIAGIRIEGRDAAGKVGTTKPFVVDVKPLPTVVAAGTSVRTGQDVAVSPTTTDLYGSQTWRLAAGTLPVGLTLDADTGRIRGTAEQKGSFPGLVLQVTDADGASGRSAPFEIVATSNMAVAGLRAAYPSRTGKALAAIRPYATGAAGSVTWSMAAGSTPLPAGLSLDQFNGALTGTPAVAGTYAGLSIKATDSSNGELVASDPFTLTVADAPTLAMEPRHTLRLGATLALTPTVTNVLGQGRWSVDGTLPKGVTVDAATGAIGGKPLGTGSATGLALKVTDLFDGARAQGGRFSIETLQALRIAAAGVPTARVDQPFAMAAPGVTGLQGAAGIVLSGTLPDGLKANPDGTVTGTPKTAGNRTGLSYTVTDAKDGAVASSPGFGINVLDKAAPVPFEVSGVAADYGATLNQAFALQPTVTGSKGSVSWTLEGTKPVWLSLDAATGRLSGTPGYATTATGLRLVATDTDAKTAKSPTFAVRVVPAGPLSVALPGTMAATVDGFFSGPAPSVANGQGALAFETAGARLPDGLTVSPISGVISGTSRTAGDYAGIQVLVTDGSGASATSGAVTLSVRPDPADTDPAGAEIPANLTGVVAGAFSATPVAHGLAAPVAWTLDAGAKPAWLAIDAATGALSGVPTEIAEFPGLVLKATGSDGRGARTNAFAVSVVAQPVLSATMASISAIVSRSSATYPSVSGAQGLQTWRLASGTLPPGLEVDPGTGRIGGTPGVLDRQAGLALTVRDATGAETTTNAFSISVVPAPTLMAAMSNPLQAFVGYGFAAAPGVSGAQGSVSWSLTAGGLPSGFDYDPATGRISGSGLQTGYYPGLVLTVSDAAGASAETNPFALSIADYDTYVSGSNGTGGGTGGAGSDTAPPAGTNSTTAPVSVSQGSTLSISGVSNYYPVYLGGGILTAPPAVSGARGAVSFQVTGGAPGWLGINPSTGSLFGTPTAVGTWGGLAIVATDGYGTATAYPITVSALRQGLSASGPSGSFYARTGAAFSAPVPRVSGALGSVSWSSPSALPQGVALDPANGRLSGTVTTAGTTAGIVLVARDAYDGATATTAAFDVAVGDTLSIAGADYTARQGYPFAAQPVATNPLGAQRWSLDPGSAALPSWLVLNASSGRLTGTAGSIGTTSGIVLAMTDASGATAVSRPFSVTAKSGLVAYTTAGAYYGRAGMGLATDAAIASGANGAVTWTIASGTLPGWATLNAASGAISGLPDMPATLALTLRARDARGDTAVTPAFTVSVSPRPAIAVAATSAVRAGAAFTLAPGATHSYGYPTWRLAGGTLPAGLSLDPSSGRIEGRVAQGAAASYANLVVSVTDGQGATGTSAPFAIEVTPGPAITGLQPSYGGRQNSPFAMPALGASNTLGAVSWYAGGQPTGLALAGSALTGSTSRSGSYATTFTLVDAGDGAQATGTATLAIAPGLRVVTSPADIDIHVGQGFASRAPAFVGQRGSGLEWSLFAGTQPPGSTVAAPTGILSSPLQASVGSFLGLRLKVTDPADGALATTDPFSVTVHPEPAVVQVPTLYTARFDAPLTTSPPVLRDAVGAVAWKWGSTAVPPSWASVDPATGRILGKPDALVRTNNLTLVGTDATTLSATSVPFSLAVFSLPQVTLAPTTTTYRKRVGDAFGVVPLASGISQSTRWSMDLQGALPAGVGFNDANGTVSGTVGSATQSSFSIVATDSADGTPGSSARVALTTKPALVMSGLKPAYRIHVNDFLTTDAPTIAGAENTVSYALSAQVPVGMNPFDTVGGVLSGSPTQATGAIPLTITATDPWDGRTATGGFTFQAVGPLSLATVQDQYLAIGADATIPVVASNVVGSATYALLKDDVPRPDALAPCGLALSPSTGAISGRPTATCSVTGLSVEVSDAGTPNTGETGVSNAFTVGTFVASVTLPPEAQVPVEVLEGSARYVQAATTIPSPTWSLSGNCPACTVGQDGRIWLYAAPPLTKDASYTVTVKAENGNRVASATLTLAAIQATGTATPVVAVRSSGTFTSQLATNVSNGYWSVLSYNSTPTNMVVSPNAPGTATFTGRAPAVTQTQRIDIYLGNLKSVAPDAGARLAEATVSFDTFPAFAFTEGHPNVSGVPGTALASSGSGVKGLSGKLSYALLTAGGADISDKLGATCAGLGFERTTGTISGTPTANCGLAGLSLQADDDGAPNPTALKATVSQSFNLTVASSMAVATAPSSPVAVVQGGSVTVDAAVTGSPYGALTWALRDGASPAPSWITLVGCTGTSKSCTVRIAPTGTTAVANHPSATTSYALTATDAAGTVVTLGGIRVAVAAPTVTLNPASASIQEGATVGFQGTTGLNSPIWSMTGAPAGSTIDAATGAAVLYAPEIPATPTSVSSTVVVTATANGATKSANFALTTTPATATLTPAAASVHSGGSLVLATGTSMTAAGTWSASSPSGDVGGLSFAGAANKTNGTTFVAPAVSGTSTITRTVTASFTSSAAPANGTPAVASATGTYTVHPPLAITGIAQPNYTVAEGASLTLTPAAVANSLIGGATWSQTGLPNGITMDSAGRISGSPPGGTAASHNVVAKLQDGGDTSPAGTATVSFAITVTPAALLAASPNPVGVGAQVAGTAGVCTPITVTNSGSLTATGLGYAVTGGTNASDFRTCTPATGTSCIVAGSLATGQSCVVGLQLNATVDGPKSATTQLTAANATALTIPATGTTDVSALYPFTAFTFTTCGVEGATGPTLSQCNGHASYASRPWAATGNTYYNNTGGGQLWTVPATRTYRIVASGAAGTGGNGAVMTADVPLTKGNVLLIVVGQNPTGTMYTAGGGTFVTLGSTFAAATPLLVAGGGGGLYINRGDFSAASTSTFGNYPPPGTPLAGWPAVGATGGTNGSGGGAGHYSGGGGFYSSGGENGAGTGFGYSFRSGARGGDNGCGNGVGGFGGGGGGCPGGGGGYSGGGGGINLAGSSNYYGGGGGGSYSATAVIGARTLTNGNTGPGSVTITAR
jgi:hypothetical protein